MPCDFRTIAVSLTAVRYSTLPENYDEGRCLACDGPLDLHQLDLSSPDRIVGLCELCGAWYMMDLIPGTDEAVMVALPDSPTILDGFIG